MCHFFISIAPGTYDVEKADKRIHESSPSYSLGVKPKEPKHEDIPGKLLNCHSLHNTVVNDVVELFTIKLKSEFIVIIIIISF